jgi:hypothetical protein
VLLVAGKHWLAELAEPLERASARGLVVRTAGSSGTAEDYDSENTLVLVIDASQCLIGGSQSGHPAMMTTNKAVVAITRQHILAMDAGLVEETARPLPASRARSLPSP